MIHKACIAAATAALSLALGACGGGGEGGHVATIPPPPPPPPPTTASITIFAHPMVGEFASAGVSTTVTSETSGFGTLSNADADQVHIRYTSSGNYEIKMPGADWDILTFAKGTVPQDPEFANDFQPEHAPQTGAHLDTGISRTDGYGYSEIASWFDGSGRIGELAFGEPTPAGEIPHNGSAVYHGIAQGTSDIISHNSFEGSFRTPVGGPVELSFDFGKGTLDGYMSLHVGDSSPATYAFEDTVLSVSSGMYSGKFDTGAKGENFFLGQFTGPHGEETIASWALPFIFTQMGLMTMPDGQTHQAFGAWIAKTP